MEITVLFNHSIFICIALTFIQHVQHNALQDKNNIIKTIKIFDRRKCLFGFIFLFTNNKEAKLKPWKGQVWPLCEQLSRSVEAHPSRLSVSRCNCCRFHEQVGTRTLLHNTSREGKLPQESSFNLLKIICTQKFSQKSNQASLSSQSLWESGPESRRSSWTSMSRAPSLHRRSQSGEMESLLSDMHTCSNLSSREQSLDQPEYLQVPMLLSPDCNGTTFHLPDQSYDEAPLPSYYHDDREEETEEVNKQCWWYCSLSRSLFIKGNYILMLPVVSE